VAVLVSAGASVSQLTSRKHSNECSSLCENGGCDVSKYDLPSSKRKLAAVVAAVALFLCKHKAVIEFQHSLASTNAKQMYPLRTAAATPYHMLWALTAISSVPEP
jgi:hypothetical protein